MYYTVYKTTNQIDGKFYIGTHKTENLDDTYMGSGKYLKRAIEKYGVENFVKEILFVFDSPEPMFEKEKELVNEDFLATENTYNLKIGGFGGWDYNNTETGQKLRETSYSKWQEAGKSAWIQKYYSNDEYRTSWNQRLKKSRQTAFIKIQKMYPDGTFKGRSHNNETILKMKASAIGKHKGEKNSQFGTMWITDGKENAKILKTDPIPANWKAGRVIKNMGH